MKRIANNQLEKFRLIFSRCTNRDVAPLRKEEEMKLERQILEEKYELEQASLQVRIIEEDNSVIGDALPQMSKQPGPSIGELNSKHAIEPKVKDFKSLTGTKLDEDEDNDDVICRSLLNPCAKEFSYMYPAVKADSELSCSNTVNSDVAIVEDVLDKLGSTIRQGFALPKPDLSTFNGNPMEYWSFIRSFENTIERNASNESEKLMYLLKYTTGEAKKTIECCVVMDPSKGYQTARKFRIQLPPIT